MKIVGMTKKDKIVIFLDENSNFNYAYLEEADSTIRSYDYMYEHYDAMKDECDPKFVLNLCDEYGCPPSELPAILAAEAIEDETKAMEELDCSLYPEILNIDGIDYIFISAGFGPLDLYQTILTIDETQNLLNENPPKEKLDNKEILRKLLKEK